MTFCFEDLEVITGGLSATNILTEPSRFTHPMGSGNIMFVASEVYHDSHMNMLLGN